jgi:S-adenosylmethionine uptake transporter
MSQLARLSGSIYAGPLLALVAFAIYSAHDVIVKSLGAGYNPVQIVFFSVLLGLPFALLMLMRDRTDGNLLPRRPGWTALRTLMTVINAVCVFYAFSVLPMATTYAILFTTPLMITVLSVPMLGEKVGWRRGTAVMVGLAGVLIVLRPGQGDGIGLGHVAGLVGAFGSAINMLILRKIGPEERNVVLLIYPMMVNLLVMGMVLPFVYKPMPLGDFLAVAAMAFMAFVATLCVIAAYKRSPAAQVAPLQYSQMIWAVIFGTLFFAEAVDLFTIVGATVIIASGIYIVLREDRANVSDNQPVMASVPRSDSTPYAQGDTLPDDTPQMR